MFRTQNKSFINYLPKWSYHLLYKQTKSIIRFNTKCATGLVLVIRLSLCSSMCIGSVNLPLSLPFSFLIFLFLSVALYTCLKLCMWGICTFGAVSFLTFFIFLPKTLIYFQSIPLLQRSRGFWSSLESQLLDVVLLYN